MALIVIPSLLSKRPWARIRARCEASFFIVRFKSSCCCSARGHTNLTLIYLGIGFTYRIVLKLSRGILYQTTFGRALIKETPGVSWRLWGSPVRYRRARRETEHDLWA